MAKIINTKVAQTKARLEAFESILEHIQSQISSAEWGIKYYQERIDENVTANFDDDNVDYDYKDSYEYEKQQNAIYMKEAFEKVYKEIEKII